MRFGRRQQDPEPEPQAPTKRHTSFYGTRTPGTGYMEYTAISHDDEGNNAKLLGTVGVRHPHGGGESWHNYSHSTWNNGRNVADTDHYGRVADYADPWQKSAPLPDPRSNESLNVSYTDRTPSFGQDRPLFVNRGEHDPHAWGASAQQPATLDFMRVAKEGRHLVPTMLGLAQFHTATTTGRTLQPDTDLSDHSARLVQRLADHGVTEFNRTNSNSMTFGPAPRYESVDAMMQSSYPAHWKKTFFGAETEGAARRLGRQLVRDTSHRQKQSGPQPEQLQLPGLG